MSDAISAAGLCKVYGAGVTAVHALDGVDFDVGRGRVRRDHGALRLRQEHAAAHPRRARPATAGAIVVAGVRYDGLDDGELTRLRRRPPGLRLPVLQPAAVAHGGRERPAARAHRPAARPRASASARRAAEPCRARRPRRARARASSPAASSSASRSRGRCCCAAAAARRRADGQPRLARRRRGPAPPARRSAATRATPIVMVTHDPRAAAIADRVVFLRDGRIAGEVRRRLDATRHGGARLASRRTHRRRAVAGGTAAGAGSAPDDPLVRRAWRCASCGTRPLRSLLTRSAIVLGVGMVFGVLLLVGTIRRPSTTSSTRPGARPTSSSARQTSAGTLPEPTRSSASRATHGVAVPAPDGRRRASRASTRDGRPIKGAQGPDVGRRLRHRRRAARTTSAESPAATRARATEMAVERNWARDHGVARRRRGLASPRPPGRARAARRRHLHASRAASTSAATGSPAMPLADARPAHRPARRGWHADQRRPATDRGQVERVQRRLEARARRRRRGGDAAGVQRRGRRSSSQALDVVLYFFSGIALFVGGFLILNCVQHDGAAAHARDRDAAHARRHAPR